MAAFPALKTPNLMKKLLLSLCALCAISSALADTYRFAKLGGTNGALVSVDVTPTSTPFVFGGTIGGGMQTFGLGAGLSIDAGSIVIAPDWLSVVNTPTTLAGYGITDALTADLAENTYEPIIGPGTLALSKLATDPLARANHTGTQLLATISDAGALAALNAVTSATITDGAIVNADISDSAAIALSKLATDPLARANHTGTQDAATIGSGTLETARLDVASQAQAEAGTATDKVMTPERTAQAIAALAGGGGHSDVQVFTANGTWTKPAGAVSIDLVIIGGGAGGSSGARGPNGANRFGGSGGGPGKCVYLNHASALTFGATEAVVVGSGGTGAAGITTDGTNGQVGTAGGDSSFGPWKAAGGAAPTSFSTSAPAVTNSCYLFNTIAASGASGGAGATPAAITALAPTGGGGGTTLSSSNQASFSGSGGGYTSSFSSGGLYTGTVLTGGALGAKSSVGTPTNGGDGGAVMLLSGTGGGGGGGAQPTISGGVSANGANGGNGGLYGGGGGGGSASEDGFTSGAGGNGGDGIVIIITHY